MVLEAGSQDQHGWALGEDSLPVYRSSLLTEKHGRTDVEAEAPILWLPDAKN